MLLPPKRAQVSCLALLGDLAEASLEAGSGGGGGAGDADAGELVATPVPPVSAGVGVGWLGAGAGTSPPEVPYFHGYVQAQAHQSRWREDWEELELLVRVHVCAGGRVLMGVCVGKGRVRRRRQGAEQD